MSFSKIQIVRGALILGAAWLSACGGGGGGGSSGSTPVSGQSLVLTSTLSAAPADSCPNGGITVDAGIDSNNNKVLDASEVTSTQYVCNGGNGLSTLVQVANEVAGANCASGGKKVDAGLDTNSNGILETAEITSTAYVCNGATGATGATGANGANGSNGLNSLMAIVPEPAGTFCTYGGSKVSSGVDSNANGILDSAEITAGNYVCNGAPGATGATGPAGPGVTWVNVTGTAVQAASNTGYMANNAAQVTIALPSAPAVGDVVQVSGIGTGGWKVAQQAGQSIIFKGTTGTLWTARETVRSWRSVASSADGSKLVAAADSGQLYTSIDAGATWVARETARRWLSVASSADGSKLAAAAYGGQIYTSTDAGVTWTPHEAARWWISVASSADGSKLVAAVQNGQLYTSDNAGVTWTARETARGWGSVASSADGSKLVALDQGTAGQGGMIYTSTDGGVTWTVREPGAGMNWFSVASSADGSKLVAAVGGGQIYTSADGGVIWTARESVRNWVSVASSADGSKLVAAANGGQLYTSTDSGVTWTTRETDRTWWSVASSEDGSKLVAAASGGQLYTSIPSTTVGTVGSISGAQYDSVDLQCVDTNTFMVRGYVGNLVVQ